METFWVLFDWWASWSMAHVGGQGVCAREGVYADAAVRMVCVIFVVTGEQHLALLGHVQVLLVQLVLLVLVLLLQQVLLDQWGVGVVVEALGAVASV